MTNKTTDTAPPRWLVEFGQEYAVPAVLTRELEDLSWHNDIYPSFTTPDLAQNDSDYCAGVDVRLWVAHPDPAQRESAAHTRYSVTAHFGEHETVWQGDDLDEAREVLRFEAAKYTQPAHERKERVERYTPPWITAEGESRLTLPALRDVLSRVLVIMDEQQSDNGEPFREGNEALYAEVQSLVSLCDDCERTTGELCVPTSFGDRPGLRR